MATLVPIPRRAADVTSEWLSAALAADVTQVDVAPIGTGQTGATYRVSATYATKQDLPATFAIKLPAQDDTVRERVALGYLSEVEFYTDVADRVRIPVPRCFYSDISEGGTDFVLVLADMAPAVQGDQIAGCAPREAGSRWRRWPDCTARAGAIRFGSGCRPSRCPNRATRRRRRASVTCR